MKKKLLLLSAFFCIFFFQTTSQNLEYSALLIPNSLKENANAVVRNNSLEITIEDVDEMVVKRRVVVTVLNKLGQADARISESYDDDTKIKDLSAVIYDAFGKEINKFKERDFLDVSAVSGGTLYSDSRVKYIDYTPISYPYTLVFESEYKTATTGFIPRWFPVNGYYVSVQKSSYSLKNPKNIPFRKKYSNFDGFNIIKSELENNLNLSIKNQSALKFETSTVASRKILPKAIVALNKSTLKGVYGEYTNWKEFGKWMHDKLLVGRDQIDDATKAKILKLVEGVKNPIQRAKLVYQFMQNRTRYISVQVGIGGWEPIAANQVDNVGYGDCKGLTNYTKALLEIADVTSYYTVVYAKEKRDIDKDFASIQGNHVILNIPNKGKDIWLECTSQTMPFGFLGSFTEDRNVLVIKPEGGVIKRTASYKDEKNIQITKANITLETNGNLTANLNRVSKGIQYDDKMGLETFSDDEIAKYYKSNIWSYNNNLSIVSKEIINDRDSVFLSEKLIINIKEYASIQNDEYLFRINVFNTINQVPKRYRNRKLPLEIVKGYKDIDEYTIKIPEGYTINYLPEPRKISTKFGTYNSEITKIDDKTLLYKRSVVIKSGLHPKEDYNSYRKFRRTTARLENQRISIIKK